MTRNTRNSATERLPVWVAMGEHFLDTETRAHIPHTALSCVRAGLTPIQAREIWRKEVTPTLIWNLLGVAGEWTGWDEAWLCEEIEKTRRANLLVKNTLHRAFVRLTRSTWLPIERSMRYLGCLVDEQRWVHARALSELIHIYIDFSTTPTDLIYPEVISCMKQLYPEPFLSIISSRDFDDEHLAGQDRIRDFFNRLELMRHD